MLRSIFGEKAIDVTDTSLKMPSGSSGIVVDVRVFNRHGIEKDERSITIERAEIDVVQQDRIVEEEIEAVETTVEELVVETPKENTEKPVISEDAPIKTEINDTISINTSSISSKLLYTIFCIQLLISNRKGILNVFKTKSIVLNPIDTISEITSNTLPTACAIPCNVDSPE